MKIHMDSGSKRVTGWGGQELKAAITLCGRVNVPITVYEDWATCKQCIARMKRKTK